MGNFYRKPQYPMFTGTEQTELCAALRAESLEELHRQNPLSASQALQFIAVLIARPSLELISAIRRRGAPSGLHGEVYTRIRDWIADRDDVAVDPAVKERILDAVRHRAERQHKRLRELTERFVSPDPQHRIFRTWSSRRLEWHLPEHIKRMTLYDEEFRDEVKAIYPHLNRSRLDQLACASLQQSNVERWSRSPEDEDCKDVVRLDLACGLLRTLYFARIAHYKKSPLVVHHFRRPVVEMAWNHRGIVPLTDPGNHVGVKSVHLCLASIVLGLAFGEDAAEARIENLFENLQLIRSGVLQDRAAMADRLTESGAVQEAVCIAKELSLRSPRRRSVHFGVEFALHWAISFGLLRLANVPHPVAEMAAAVSGASLTQFRVVENCMVRIDTRASRVTAMARQGIGIYDLSSWCVAN